MTKLELAFRAYSGPWDEGIAEGTSTPLESERERLFAEATTRPFRFNL